jgi:hypothetical protein
VTVGGGATIGTEPSALGTEATFGPVIGRAAPVAAARLDLMVVEHDEERVRELAAAGATSFLVDWEVMGKDLRQQGFDTEIRPGTPADLAVVAGVPGVAAWCRINRFGPHTAAEVETAVAAGAAGVFLPMVRTAAEVEAFLRLLDRRAGAGILVETVAALDCARDLAKLPLDRVYFGLNDFAIDRGGGPIFRAVLDGSVARARAAFPDVEFGFGGLTAIEAGAPVPCRYLLEEMARLDCRFTLLRRSFRRDLATREPRAVIAGLHAAWRACRARSASTAFEDHERLSTLLATLG